MPLPHNVFIIGSLAKPIYTFFTNKFRITSSVTTPRPSPLQLIARLAETSVICIQHTADE